MLQVQLLGGFYLAYGDAPVTALDSARLQALLAYLLLHRHALIPRQQIAFQFWPDSSEAQARANLRRTLYLLRRVWPDAERYIHIEARTLQWRTDAAFSLDVAGFVQEVEAFEHLSGHEPVAAQAHAEEAVALYQGDLFPNCYDEWIEPERERLRRLYVDTLVRLIYLLEDRREYGQAIGYAERLLQQDLLREQSHAILMRLHMLAGDRAAALSTYHTCASVLQQELGVEPGPELQAAYTQLMSKDAPPVATAHRASPRGEVIRLVGRYPEWQQLRAAWRAAMNGHAHLVRIQGEAGIGKSRLAAELGRWAQEQGVVVATARAYATADRLAYAPIIDLLRKDPLYAALQRLDPVWQTEAARLLPEFLVEHAELPRPQPLSERWQRQRLFETLARGVLAEHRAKLLIIDDLQWCDPDSLDWISYLLRFAPQAQLLVVGTMRPEEVDAGHPAQQLALDLQRTDQLREIVLAPLAPEETGQLAGQMAANGLDEAAVHNLHRLSGGNPLFVVEMLRAGALEPRDSSSAALEGEIALALPPKIQAVIQSRLGRLSPVARRLAYVAATFGRAFTFAAVHAASSYDEDRLVHSLDELWQRGIVREQGPRAYDFSHDLIREATYAEIGPVQGPILHQHVARALERVHADDLDAVSAQLAVHYDRAGEAEQAVGWYVRAAEIARSRIDDAGATAHLNRALTLLATLPDIRRNQERELSIRLQLNHSLQVAEGFWAYTIGDNAARAIELCRKLGDQHHLRQALAGMRVYHQMRADYAQGIAVAQEMVTVAEQILQSVDPPKVDDLKQMAFAHRQLGTTLLHMGELTSARSRYDIVLSIEHTVRGCIFAATADWLLGYPDQARRWAYRAVVAVRNEAHPLELAFAAFNIARISHFQRRWKSMKLWAAKAIALSSTYDIPFYLTLGRLSQARIMAEEGAVEQGIAQLRACIAHLDKVNHYALRTLNLGLLAEAYAAGCDLEAALETVQQALDLVERNQEGMWHAELLRLRGEYLWAQDGPSAASEAAFQAAIAIAQQQQAKSLELRAAVSLARLWQETGQPAQAFELLSPIYRWFTEGFNSPDLRAARALLEQLRVADRS